MTNQHTSGPWAWKRSRDYAQLVHFVEGETYPNGDDKYVEVIDDGSAGGEYNATIDVDGPDARLIAAAPDLLYALQFVMSAHGEQLTTAFEMAHEAIAKATGEAA